MSISRRKFLSLSGIVAASTILASCAPPREWAADALRTRPVFDGFPQPGNPAWRTLNRLTFGVRADELARANEIGIRAWIEEQLAPSTLDDRDAELRLRSLDTLAMDTGLLLNVRPEIVPLQLQQAAVLRAVYSRRQLYETMVDFWSDHFNISTRKNDCGVYKTIDDREVIRPHALGNFGELLWASMRSPAMLKYLDNQENYKGSPNENYARELMELHSLGVSAGYTQTDVREVARAVTGWGVNEKLRRGHFEFDASQHDDSEKIILGSIQSAGSGEGDGERVFEQIMRHPALPQFISRKLVRRFVADDPPSALIASAARTFAQSGGDIKAVLNTIFDSVEFNSAPPKFKRPLHFVAGALRQLDASTDGGTGLLEQLARMGQPLFEWQTPDGFPDYTEAWNGSLLARWQFALGLANGTLPGTALDLNRFENVIGTGGVRNALNQFSALLLGAYLPQATADALAQLIGDELDEISVQTVIAILLASPQYQWR